MLKICAISAGMMSPKKGDQPFRRAHRYLNYGLLGLASSFGAPVSVYHGNFDDPEYFLSTNPEIKNSQIILLSIPSFYALPWAQTLVSALYRSISPPTVHVGGRWVIDHNRDFVDAHFPRDVVTHPGMGEKALLKLARECGINRRIDEEELPPALNYELLVERDSFHPSIEVSRGCGLGCSFCEEANVRLTGLKSPSTLLDEVELIQQSYGQDRNFYFESSMFAPSESWVDQFVAEYKERDMSFRWRTETRVDVLTPDKIRQLASAGLSVLDLGLESGSPTQIRNMKKSSNPYSYLEKAEATINACHKYAVWAKVNILLYPGETTETVGETRSFLRANAGAVYGVSAYPVAVYGVGERKEYFELLYRSQGAVGLSPTNIKGVWDVNLSREIDSYRAKEIANEIAREFMPSRNYFDLKNFSYLDPRYDWKKFQKDIRNLEWNQRSFGE